MKEETPKVSWTIEEGNLKSGEGATMTIDIELKDEYHKSRWSISN